MLRRLYGQSNAESLNHATLLNASLSLRGKFIERSTVSGRAVFETRFNLRHSSRFDHAPLCGRSVVYRRPTYVIYEYLSLSPEVNVVHYANY